MTAPFYDMVDLRGGRPRKVHGLEIVAMGPGLAADLNRLGWEDPAALAFMAQKIMIDSKNVAEPGEPPLYEAEFALWDQPDVRKRVWAEPFGDRQATVYYPHER